MRRTTERLRTVLGHLKKADCSTTNGTRENMSQSECAASMPRIHDKEFKFTLNSTRLTREQRQFYEDNGYIIIKKLVDDYILNLCRDHFVNICNDVCPTEGMFLMKEPTRFKAGATGEHLYYKIQDILYDNVFSQYTAMPKLLDYVQCFTGPNITAIHSMLINKPPGAQETAKHPLHQDMLYFPFRPVNLIVGTWTAMETIDTENGCLVVVPGSHKPGLLYRHGSDNQGGSYKTFLGVKNLQNMEAIPLCMEKGDTVFLHPLIVHGSGPNRSKKFRKAISCHYAASECRIIDTKNTFHDVIARDFEATALKSKNVSFDFSTIMKLRSVVVRGLEGFTATI